MRETINCLREYATLKEGDQPAYLVRMGSFLTTNTATFPDIPNAGSVITGHAGTLLTKFGLKDTSETAMNAYITERDLVITKVEANYDDIDLVAQGDGVIVAKAGVRGTSASTASIGIPSTPENLKFAYVDEAGELQISRDVDSLALGSVIITFTDPAITVVKSGNTQLTINTGSDNRVEIHVDVSTTIKSIIQRLEEGKKTYSVVSNFNRNGISPVASPRPVTVPS